MQIIGEISEIGKKLHEERLQNCSIGFVPTMGFFHHGHMALMKKAREENNVVVVSIFVNPTQFGEGEDLESYPQDLERDSEIAEQLGVDYLFTPAANQIYTADYQTFVEVEKLSRPLCGKARPGHFKGVATVVLKLFNIIDPDRAYFGLKDYQQYRLVERMVLDLNLRVEIKAVPTVRDEDGLAASSRNSYLTYDEREEAAVLFRALNKAKELYEKGTNSSADLISGALDMINKRPLVQLEYMEIVERKTLQPIEKVVKNNTLIAIAAKVGKARLIDNIEI